MQDLYKFIEYSNVLLASQLNETSPKHLNFLVAWNNADYEVHYVFSSKHDHTGWEMMAYARLS